MIEKSLCDAFTSKRVCRVTIEKGYEWLIWKIFEEMRQKLAE